MRVFILPFVIAFVMFGCGNQSPELTKNTLQESICRDAHQFSYKQGGRKWGAFGVINVSQENPDYVKARISEKGIKRETWGWYDWGNYGDHLRKYEISSRISVYEIRRDSARDGWYVDKVNDLPIRRFGFMRRYIEFGPSPPAEPRNAIEPPLMSALILFGVCLASILVCLYFFAPTGASALQWTSAAKRARAEKQRELQQAVADNDIDRVKRLVDTGVDLNGRLTRGVTPLMLAAEAAHLDIVRLLLARGSSPNLRDFKHGATALMAAAKSGDTEIVNALLAGGADVNAKNRQGRTALFYAASRNHPEAVKLLLSKGANPASRDKRGWTALKIAAEFNHTEIMRLLQAAGAPK